MGSVATAAILLLAVAAAAADGRQAYQRQCAPCHGASGRGDGPDAPLFVRPPRDLREGFLARYPTDELVRRVRRGEPLRLDVDPTALRRRLTDVEALVAYLQRLPSIDWARADAGWVVYIDRCTACHGPYGTPVAVPPAGVRPPRSLADPAFQAATSDATMVDAVRHGRAGMPALTPRLSEADAHQVAAFVRLFSPGFAIYASSCAACHGDHGVPSGGFAEAVPQPTVIFNHAYFARHDPEALRGAVWHMLDEHTPVMPHYAGALTEADAAAIVEYLKQPP